MKHYQAFDYKEWDEAALDLVLNSHEMCFVNQEPDGFDCLKGEWFVADDPTRTIIYGTFSNYHSPGASHFMSAFVYEPEEEDDYQDERDSWMNKPEYLEQLEEIEEE